MTGPDPALRYVYLVARGLTDADVAGLTGVDGTGVRTLAEGDLVAVLSDVDRTRFDVAALEGQREDLTWLAATARAHHHVVDALGREHAVVPLALATVYFDDERVRAVLRDGHDDLTGVLDRLAGHAEWGIKAWVRAGSTAAADTGRAASGAEYLRRRRQALRDRDQGVDDATRAAEEIHEAAAAVALASRRHRLQESSLTGRSERQVLNGAHLVDADGARALADLVAGLDDHPRLQVELTGPWVPYSFAAAAVPT